MRIGLIDVDSHNFPNLPLMKLSAYHKSIGDTVEWCNNRVIFKSCPDFKDYRGESNEHEDTTLSR